MNVQTPIKAEATADLSIVKGRQQAAWSSGDYCVVGSTLQIVGENICEAVDLRAGQRVLDVAAGNGNASLAAARCYADVVSTDYVPALLKRGSERAAADRFSITFQEADVEKLPFGDTSFDVVLSTFGVMFTPDHEKAASEMLRVCKTGGKIGMANWTPQGFIGQLFKTIGSFVPPAAGVLSPAMWGTRQHIEALFADGGAVVSAEPRQFTFRYRSPAHCIDVFKTYYGPMLKAYEALDDEKRKLLTFALHDLIGRFNRADDGTMVVPSEYLQIVVARR